MATTNPIIHTRSSTPVQRLAEQAFSRAAGAPLIGGNAIDLMFDSPAHFDTWLATIATARRLVLIENYIIRDDEVGRRFRDALAERASAGVRVCVLRDWLGCLGLHRSAFWRPLLDAGGEVRTYNPPQFSSPIGWISRNHRKLLVVDGEIGYVSGVCLSAKWNGDPAKGIAPWRDTGLALRGPAVAELVTAFGDTWAQCGTPLSADVIPGAPEPAGDVDVRVVATVPATAGLFRLDQLIAAMARKTLWIADAYFVGLPPYVQALRAAALDGVDVRLLVPGASDVPAVAKMSRAGYRPLLEAGVRVFEWNGSMMHAKTAVADGRWARVGSSNLNIASWLGNCEIDIVIENDPISRQLEVQYESDLGNATEIVLTKRPRGERSTKRQRVHGAGGSSSRAAAGVLRLAHNMSAALGTQRVLGRAEANTLPWATVALLSFAVVAIVWPRAIAWPLAVVCALLGFSLFAGFVKAHKAAASRPPAKVPAATTEATAESAPPSKL